MARLVIKGSLEDKMHKYLIVKHDDRFMPHYSLANNAPKEIQEYFKKWIKEMTKVSDLK